MGKTQNGIKGIFKVYINRDFYMALNALRFRCGCNYAVLLTFRIFGILHNNYCIFCIF